MNPAWKGALLSALVMPGLGQVVLKRPLRGLAIMGAVLLGIIVFVVKATAVAVRALESPMVADGGVDMATATAAAEAAVGAADGLIMQGALLWIVCCWVVSAVDAYRIGQKQRKDL
jgi:hypothetical protein